MVCHRQCRMPHLPLHVERTRPPPVASSPYTGGTDVAILAYHLSPFVLEGGQTDEKHHAWLMACHHIQEPCIANDSKTDSKAYTT